MRHPAVVVFAFVAVAFSSLAQESRPSITYGPSRTSSSWVETPHGRVAVDRGVSWQGVKVYLSLTWDLVATDEATGKTLWHDSVGAFWNEIGFAELDREPGVKAWAVELRPGPRARDGADRRQYHDLRTGKRIDVPEPPPSGRTLLPLATAHGRSCAIEKPRQRVVAGEADWKAFVVGTMFASEIPPKLAAVDFEKSVAIVLAAGKSANCNGIEFLGAWEDDRRILVRVDEITFQTFGPGGGGEDVTPWGIVVLPRRDPFKLVVVERNAQGLIGGPPIWKEVCRFDAPGDPVKPAPQRAGR